MGPAEGTQLPGKLKKIMRAPSAIPFLRKSIWSSYSLLKLSSKESGMIPGATQ